ncbi:hypothetical protein [Microbacterium sp. Root180]|uniref:hypothetical protein n=1 Tax=Microbacterium sp. Root180 TaxID=1736483 RepID=UPI0012F8B488|nr:hypothetical protein [Microbacterium sp. Root180]
MAGVDDARLHALVRRTALAAEARAIAEAPSTTPRWKRRRTMIPLGIAGVVALTGAALVLPLTQFGIGGMLVDADAIIPIKYTTDTGVDVSCRKAFYFGDPADRTQSDRQIAAFVADHDWTGIGQDMYEYAIAHPFVPGRDGGLQVDTQQARDEMSLSIAIDHHIAMAIPLHLRDERGELMPSAVTDCQGQLH